MPTHPADDIPPEIHLLIARNLDLPALVSLKLTNRYFFNLITPPTRAQLAKASMILISRIGSIDLTCQRCRAHDSTSGKGFNESAGRCVQCGIPNQSWRFTRLKYLGEG